MLIKAFPLFSVQGLYTKDFIFGLVYKFRCGPYNAYYSAVDISHLYIRSGEHIGVSPVTGKKIKPTNSSAVNDHLIHSIYLFSLNSFSVLTHEN